MPTSSVCRTAAAAAVAVGSLTFFGAAAGAQTCYPPTPGCVTTTSPTPGTPAPTLTLSDRTVTRGQRITATVANFQPGSSGIITIASVEQQVGTFTMPATGSTSTAITIPSNISLGAHTVFARGTAITGQPASASVGITVIAAGTGTDDDGGGGGGTGGSTLARTGFALGSVAVVGVGLVAGGMALKRSGRRGRANSAG